MEKANDLWPKHGAIGSCRGHHCNPLSLVNGHHPTHIICLWCPTVVGFQLTYS